MAVEPHICIEDGVMSKNMYENMTLQCVIEINRVSSHDIVRESSCIYAFTWPIIQTLKYAF